MNPITLADVYKLGHRNQSPPGITRVYSNLTARASRVPGCEEVISFGGQYFRQKYLVEEMNAKFFGISADEACAKYKRRVDGVLGPNNVGTDHIRQLHGLGYMPLEFRALPEGTAVPLRVPILTIENTHDDFAWLTNYVETIMSNVMWMPCTSATTALGFRRTLDAAAKATGGDPAFVDWQGHDFSMRGLAGPEAAALSGAGHLLFFTGTDSLPAFDLIEDYYGVPEGYLIGGSVPATEHSVMCAGGEDDELATFSRLLDSYPEGILSVVSDTWDLWHVITDILPKLKDRIMARNGRLVIRPDSGVPEDIICGDPKARADSPASKGVVRLLAEIFGTTETPAGYKVLDTHIGCIYGDSITRDRAKDITYRLADNGFASTSTVLGIGSFTYQYVTRDTLGWAVKATWVKINGEGRDIYKTPKTDNGIKNSARGRLAVAKNEAGKLYLIEKATPEQEDASLLRPVWKDGKPIINEPYDIIRSRARLALA